MKILLLLISLLLFSTFVHAQENWTLHYVDSMEIVGEDGNATNAFDGDASTIWHTEWKAVGPSHPHEIQINFGKVHNIKGFRYLPRQDGSNGRVGQYEFYTSLNGSDWATPVAIGTFEDGTDEKTITFTSIEAQYIRFVALSEVGGHPWTTVAELSILKAGEVYEVTVTWDYPPDDIAIGFDIRVNEDNGSLISVSKDLREWTGNVELTLGQNAFDMRTKGKDDKFSVWSEPVYLTIDGVLDEPTNLTVKVIKIE